MLRFKVGDRVRITENVVYEELKDVIRLGRVIEATVLEAYGKKWPYRLYKFSEFGERFDKALFGDFEIEPVLEKGQIPLPFKGVK